MINGRYVAWTRVSTLKPCQPLSVIPPNSGELALPDYCQCIPVATMTSTTMPTSTASATGGGGSSAYGHNVQILPPPGIRACVFLPTILLFRDVLLCLSLDGIGLVGYMGRSVGRFILQDRDTMSCHQTPPRTGNSQQAPRFCRKQSTLRWPLAAGIRVLRANGR